MNDLRTKGTASNTRSERAAENYIHTQRKWNKKQSKQNKQQQATVNMTLPTNTTLNATDDDSDMFGPPRTSLMRHTRPRVPMISAKLRLREERKRILQLCAHKLERIKDSETNLRRSVCINNTYSRLTDELRREKQSRYLANLPK